MFKSSTRHLSWPKKITYPSKTEVLGHWAMHKNKKRPITFIPGNWALSSQIIMNSPPHIREPFPFFDLRIDLAI
jgi:hypothetical protein